MAVKKQVKKGKDINFSDIIKELGKKDIQVQIVDKEKPPTQYISTGDYLLDSIMGGGLPVGKFVEVYGEESTAKSTIAQHTVNNLVNNHDGYALVMDIENSAWNFPERNIQLGLDPEKVDRVLYTSPTTVEEVFSTIEIFLDNLIMKNKVKDKPILIVWDSIAASSSLVEYEKDHGNIGYTTQARVINASHRKLIAFLNRNNIHNVSFLWLNQARKELGSGGGFAPAKYVTFGGKAPAFYSSIRVELKYRGAVQGLKKGVKHKVGIQVTAKVVKNKMNQAYQSCDFYVFAKGINKAYGIFKYLKLSNLIKDTIGGKDSSTGESCHKHYVSLLGGKTLCFTNFSDFSSQFSKHPKELLDVIKSSISGNIGDVISSIVGEDEN